MATPSLDAGPGGVLPANPHVLWRQLLGLVVWTSLPAIVGGPLVLVWTFALGGVTFADAWHAGIYKQPGRKAFTNMSPMAWGIGMVLLLIVTYPMYLAHRNQLRTRPGNPVLFRLVVGLGALAIAATIIGIILGVPPLPSRR